jgi:hypothetical protein
MVRCYDNLCQEPESRAAKHLHMIKGVRYPDLVLYPIRASAKRRDRTPLIPETRFRRVQVCIVGGENLLTGLTWNSNHKHSRFEFHRHLEAPFDASPPIGFNPLRNAWPSLIGDILRGFGIRLSALDRTCS